MAEPATYERWANIMPAVRDDTLFAEAARIGIVRLYSASIIRQHLKSSHRRPVTTKQYSTRSPILIRPVHIISPFLVSHEFRDLTQILEFLDLLGCEPDAKNLLHHDDEVHIGKAVPLL